MPWDVVRRGSRHCVVKQGESRPVPGGCHATRAEAVKHQRALYASENRRMKAGKASSAVATFSAVAKPPAESAKEAADIMTELARGDGIVVVEAPEDFVEGVKLVEVEEEPETDELQDSAEEDKDEEDESEEEVPATYQWEGILTIEGMPTDDRRFLIPGEIGERDPMPRPLQWQPATSEGHVGAVTVGAIEEIKHIPFSDFEQEDFDLKGLPEKAVIVWGIGHIEDTADGRGAIEAVENGAGVSVDLPASRHALIDPESLEEVDAEEMDPEEKLMGVLSGEFLTGIAGDIAAATICTVPAFRDARLHMVTSKDAETIMVASAFTQRVTKLQALTAAAAGKAPVRPPREWFFTPEADEPTPLTVTPEGQVYGHLALWGQCHTAFAGCEVPNPSRSNYAWFHLGQIETVEDDLVDVGRITVGRGGAARGGHASIVHGTQGAIEHYDDTGCVAAFVRAVDGNLGIWLSGAVRSDVPVERIRDLRANPPSLDYRIEDGHRELVAVLSVPVPGFPIPRTEMRLVASGVTEEVTAVIVTGFWPEEEESEVEEAQTNGKAEIRAQKLAELREFEFELESEDFAKITADQRRKWAKSGIALPDGSFPIVSCSGDGPSAVNARRALGRAPEAKRNSVKRHILRRERALNCPSDDE